MVCLLLLCCCWLLLLLAAACCCYSVALLFAVAVVSWAQGPQTNHTPAEVDFHLPTTPANPQTKTKCMVQMSTTHPLLWVCGTTRIQIKPPETMTHPNGHPSICKTEYKARNRGAKSVPHTHFGRLLSFVKTRPTSTRASPQPSPSTKTPTQHNPIQEPMITVQKMSTTHPLRRVCGNFKQQVETTMQALDEPHTCRSGYSSEPHPPTEATTLPSENTRPWVRGNPNGEAQNDVPSTTHPPKRYHTPARVEYVVYF
ncbi:hypothetical protein BS47DRAFT_1368580 [Hydnum rufescens UP504]|uniref:Secreted protein n=1 Tax=Hydnum rufescens UP504 TaxID=1448309 RepID=A0A9P6DMX7_9AGAM|nr:hypothetical protein BS47DRAFT_1368580 [Hydnum rufescens UP504]